MDDEKIVRDTAGKILEQLGHKVDFAADGGEALAKYQQARENGRAFDLVIMDLTVPGGLGGKETIRRMLELDPQVKAIVSSGYSNDPMLSDFKKYGFKGIVAKPYVVEELESAVEQILGG